MDGKLKIYFEPGTDYKYSGEGYQYLAKVLREIENKDWQGLENTFQQRVAKPLNLQHTVFLQTPFIKEHKAIPYNDGRRMPPPMDNREFGAAYSIHTEAADFSKWMAAVLNEQQLTEESYSELSYLTATLNAAIWGAELALGEGDERIYLAEPTGPIEDDPNLTNQKPRAIQQCLTVPDIQLKLLVRLPFGKDTHQNISRQ